MTPSGNRKESINRYRSQNTSQVVLTLKTEDKSLWDSYAKSHDIPLATLIRKLMAEEMSGSRSPEPSQRPSHPPHPSYTPKPWEITAEDVANSPCEYIQVPCRSMQKWKAFAKFMEQPLEEMLESVVDDACVMNDFFYADESDADDEDDGVDGSSIGALRRYNDIQPRWSMEDI